MKFIVIGGGVYSGLGKGIAAASISANLVRKHKVTYIKWDGYWNRNPGTMNPREHGECFVLNDGTEADLDFGHSERFTRIPANGRQSITQGKTNELVDVLEREGKRWEGMTVELDPHVKEVLVDYISGIGKEQKADIVLLEIGGTIGDHSAALGYLTADGLRTKYGKENVMFIGIVPLVYTIDSHEPKTRPAQHSIQEMRRQLFSPDMVIVRTEAKRPLRDEQRKKISAGAGVPLEAIIDAPSLRTVYELPMHFMAQGADRIIAKALDINVPGVTDTWEHLVFNANHPGDTIKVALCGKYSTAEDSYISVREALNHAAYARGLSVDLKLIDTAENNIAERLRQFDGVIVPGGYGTRGIDGKLAAIRFARENMVPFFGLCYGLQLAVVEYARNMCGLEGADTVEITPETPHPVVTFLDGQEHVTMRSGTQRLGAQEAILREGTLVARLYGGTKAVERHRHRFEVNPAYHQILQERGLVLSGVHAHHRDIVEFIELPQDVHPFFVGTQAHPELKSAFTEPSPLFSGFVDAVYAHKKR